VGFVQLYLLSDLDDVKGDGRMKVYKVFNVRHDMSTDGRPSAIYEVRTASSREVAEELASKSWGSWGTKGFVEEQSIVVFETVEEAEEARRREIDDLGEITSWIADTEGGE
jgi:hypothetical protein